MFGPMSSFKMTSPTSTARAPAFPARAIVAAIGSPLGHELERARNIAHTNGAALHVLTPDDHVGPGTRAFGVADVVEDAQASLVVVAPDSGGRFGKSFAERVHEIADRAVLQVRNPVTGPYPEVVVATAPGSSLVSMTTAARYVANGARRLDFLHAYTSPSEPMLVAQGVGLVTIQHYRRQAEAEARERLQPAFADAKLDPSALHVEHGPAALVLSEISSRALLVIERGRSRLKHLAFGSLTRSVLANSRADVLVV